MKRTRSYTDREEKAKKIKLLPTYSELISKDIINLIRSKLNHIWKVPLSELLGSCERDNVSLNDGCLKEIMKYGPNISKYFISNFGVCFSYSAIDKWACYYGYLKIFNRGENIISDDDYNEYIISAILGNQLETIKYLLFSGDIVNNKGVVLCIEQVKPTHLLSTAIRAGNSEIFDYLLPNFRIIRPWWDVIRQNCFNYGRLEMYYHLLNAGHIKSVTEVCIDDRVNKDDEFIWKNFFDRIEIQVISFYSTNINACYEFVAYAKRNNMLLEPILSSIIPTYLLALSHYKDKEIQSLYKILKIAVEVWTRTDSSFANFQIHRTHQIHRILRLVVTFDFEDIFKMVVNSGVNTRNLVECVSWKNEEVLLKYLSLGMNMSQEIFHLMLAQSPVNHIYPFEKLKNSTWDFFEKIAKMCGLVHSSKQLGYHISKCIRNGVLDSVEVNRLFDNYPKQPAGDKREIAGYRKGIAALMAAYIESGQYELILPFFNRIKDDHHTLSLIALGLTFSKDIILGTSNDLVNNVIEMSERYRPFVKLLTAGELEEDRITMIHLNYRHPDNNHTTFLIRYVKITDTDLEKELKLLGL